MRATGADPIHIDDPAVALFMLITDISINPTRGIPFDIESFDDFILDADPGLRFLQLCKTVRQNPHLLSEIKEYSFAEYVSIAEFLVEDCNFDHPLAALQQVENWIETPEMAAIMSEAKTFDFGHEGLIVRLLISQFVEFCADKLASPHFFCWPGIYMSGPRADEKSKGLFLKHLSLFGDRIDGVGVYPRERVDVPHDNLVKTLTNFYGNIVLCDMTRQLLLRDGPFEYDYAWLSDTYDVSEISESAKRLFARNYTFSPDDFWPKQQT